MEITIKIENGIKTINGQTLEDIIQQIDSEVETLLLTHIFNHVKSEKELITELKKLKTEYSPVGILLYLKLFTKGTLSDVNDYFQEILEE